MGFSLGVFMIQPSVLQYLTDRGVRIPDPAQVWVGDDVDLDRIAAQGTVLFPGCRITGASTFLGEGAQIGSDGPATCDGSWIGPGATVHSGFCRGTVLLAGASLGSNSHVREGTILEEGASTAHAVGLKQTILFPFVTLGSLINFCDCLMAGGTGPGDHSEVGSSYIHFNFTPHQDKATASLIGDVPAGVMLDQPPIFLGGQGGMVGPCRLSFGSVTAAGTIIRKDELRPGRLMVGAGGRAGNIAYRPGAYRDLKRILTNNLTYIGNLMALRIWYRQVRGVFIGPQLPAALHQGLVHNVDKGLDERVRRLNQLCEKLDVPKATGSQADAGGLAAALVRAWPAVSETLADLRATHDEIQPESVGFRSVIEQARQAGDGDYVTAIRSLPVAARDSGRRWLQGIVDDTVRRSMEQVTGPF